MQIAIPNFAIVLLAYVGLICAGAESARAEDISARRNAIVIIATYGPKDEAAGNGICIGDGTLVVTARHNIKPRSESGKEESDGFITVISPYLGTAEEGRIVAEDPLADAALLKVDWKEHPSVSLVARNGQETIGAVDLLGCLKLASAVAAADPAAAKNGHKVDEEKITVGANSKGSPEILWLERGDKLGESWAGCPAFVPGTALLAGCVTNLAGKADVPDRKVIQNGQGFTARLIQRLVERSGVKELPAPAAAKARPSDADAMLNLILEVRGYLFQRDSHHATVLAATLVDLQPGHMLYELWLGSAFLIGQKNKEAEDHYQLVLAANPKSAQVRIIYAGLLIDTGRAKGASELLEGVAEADRNTSNWAGVMARALMAQQRSKEAEDVLLKAIKLSSRDSSLLMAYSNVLSARGKHQEAVAALQTALVLNSSDIVHILLAQQLTWIKDFAGADAQYRSALQTAPHSGRAHIAYFRFLMDYHPEQIAEAAAEADWISTNDLAVQLSQKELVDLRALVSRAQKRAATQPAGDAVPAAH